MTYDAVSAYTVLFGDGDGPSTVSVHGSAEEAWRTLDVLLGRSARRGTHRRRWGARVARRANVIPVDETAVRAAAEAWRLADPQGRFWQVSSHRLQVTVPAIGSGRVVQRSG